MVGRLEKEDATFDPSTSTVRQLPIAIAASGGLGEGVEAAFGTVDDREADIDTGLNNLGGDEDDDLACLPQSLCVIKYRNDMRRAHPSREVESLCLLPELFMKDLSRLRRAHDKKTSVGGVIKNVGDERIVVERPEILAGDPLKRTKERRFVADDRDDFIRGDADGKIFSSFESWLGGRAKDCGSTEITNETP